MTEQEQFMQRMITRFEAEKQMKLDSYRQRNA